MKHSKPNYLIIITSSILGIILLALINFLYFQNQQSIKVSVNQEISPTIQVPSPTPQTEPLMSIPPDWKTITMKGCSTRNAVFEYSLKTPNSWVFLKTQDDRYRTVYELSDEQNKRIKINCDTVGIGSVICVNGGEVDFPFQIGGPSKDGCYWTSDPNTKGYGAAYNLFNPFGAFVFTAYGIEKSLLDQILSTFQFLALVTKS